MNPRFYFATCQAGAEKAVKAEVLAENPPLRFAFSRPGFITFKEADDAAPVLALKRGIFTRLWGEVLGQAKDSAALAELLSRIPAGLTVQAFDRDQYVPGEEPPGFARNARIRTILDTAACGIARSAPHPGATVYSLIWVDDFHVFLGRHVHTDRLSGAPGNIVDITLPSDSPSRAYMKIEEAIARFRPPIPAGGRVLEVGCAPGGATTALLDRGLALTGVDPQFMDERVAARPGFNLIRKPARFVDADELRQCNPDWLVMDMSIAPLEALDELAHIVALLKRNFGPQLKLRQGFLTLKLNDWSFTTKIPLYLKRIEGLGFGGLQPIQLCSNRQEFFVWAPRFGAPRQAADR